MIAKGLEIPTPIAFFTQLERDLNIQDSNYKSIRRIVVNWEKSTKSQKSLVITRLLQYYRTNAIRSELYQAIKQLAKEEGYEIRGAKNAERKNVAAKAAAATAALAGGFALGRQIGHRIAR
jgi:hypothetical protein